MAQSVGAVALDIVMGKNTVTGVVKQSIQEVQNTFSDASAGIGTKVSAVGGAVKNMGAAMLPASTAVAGLGTSMVKTAADFDSAMSQVSAISGATGQDLEDLRDKAQEMGAKTKFSASQSAEAMTYMAMAGWKTEDMLYGIEGVMNLAAASGEDLATTSDIVTDALTAFGKRAEDSGRLADIMAAASSNANTNVAMMGETFKYAAPVAGALGYTMEDTALAIGLMANAGIKGSQAGTSLRSMFSRLASPPKECAETMDKLGISITNADGTMKPFRDVIGDLRDKFAGLSEAEQAEAAKALAGQEAMSGLLAIVNAAPTDVEKLTSAIDNSKDSAEKMAATMNDNLNGQITLLKSQLEGLAIQMGEILVPIISDVVGAISKLADWFGGLSDSTKRVVVTIGLVIAIGGPLLVVIGGIISAVGTAMTAIGAVVGILGGPVTLAIGAVIAIGTLLVANWDGIKEAASALGSWISEKWDWLKQKTSEAWGNIKQKTSETWNNVKSTVSEKATSAKNAAVEKWNELKTSTSTAWNNLKTSTAEKWNSIKESVSSKASNAKTSAISAFTSMRTGISTRISNIKNTIVNGFKSAVRYITSLPSKALQWGKDMIQGIINGIKSMIGKVGDAARGVAEKITSFLHFSVPDEGPLTDYESWMPDFIQGMTNGIEANKYRLIDAVRGMAGEMTIRPIAAPALQNVGGGNAVAQTENAGSDKVLALLTQLVGSLQNMNFTVPVYLGNDLLDEQMVKASDRRTVRSGGRV